MLLVELGFWCNRKYSRNKINERFLENIFIYLELNSVDVSEMFSWVEKYEEIREDINREEIQEVETPPDLEHSLHS